MTYKIKYFKHIASILVCLLALAFAKQTVAQEIWSLERCVTQAQQNNRNVRQALLQMKQSKLTTLQQTLQRYPSVSANSNAGLNFGRSVNPSTYTFETSTSGYNSWSLSAGVTLWNGGRINSQIEQSRLEDQATEADLEQAANTIGLNVASAYLQILLNEEQLVNASRRVQQSKDQLERLEKLIRAGSQAPNARFDLQAQIAKNEQSFVTAQNNVELAYLALKQLLEVSPDLDMRVERPNVIIPTDENPDGFIAKNVYTKALGNQANIRAGETRIKEAEIGVSIAKTAYLPTLSASASLNSNFSSSILDFTKGTPTTVRNTQTIEINGVQQPITFLQTSVTDIPKKQYFSQLSDNFGQGVGLNLSIPIYDQGRTKVSVEKAKLNVESQLVAQESRKLQLRSDIQNAIASARAAKRTMEAAQKTLDAQRAAFENTEKRFQIGAVSTFEYSQARINQDNSENDLTVAKYDYLFRLKIVAFYEGKKLSLK